jgi:hypothetical protein
MRISRGCLQLLTAQSIDLSHCGQFIDAALIAVAQSCSLLESIVVFHCTSLTDSALIATLTHCHNLEGTMIFLGNFDEDSDNDFPEESDLHDTVTYGGI